MLLAVTFTVLLGAVSALIVPPPADVTVSCQNLKTTVSWKYSQQQPETWFRVYDGEATGDYLTETVEHQYDLSPFVWKSEKRYTGLHFVTVVAMQGGNQSEKVESQTFSFNHLKSVSINCVLDFPPVIVTVKEAVATVSFPNPLHFYKELKQAVKPDDTSFEYTISMSNKTFNGSCNLKDITCKCELSFPDGVQQCVSLKGFLCSKNCFGPVVFNKVQGVCARTTIDIYAITLALMLGILVFIIVVVTVVICKVRGWTMDTYTPLPSVLQKNWDQLPQLSAAESNKENCSTVTMISNKPSRSPSLSSEDDNYPPKDPEDDSTGYGSSSRTDDGLYMDKGLSEDSNEELDTDEHRTDDDSVKTECVFIDSEEEKEDQEMEAVSAYDSPRNLQDMGNGDMVRCYNLR